MHKHFTINKVLHNPLLSIFAINLDNKLLIKKIEII